MSADRSAETDWSRLAALPVDIDRCSLEGLQVKTATGWTRHTTLVQLHGQADGGGGATGVGEDVCYEAPDQLSLQAMDLDRIAALRDCATVGEVAAAVAAMDLFGADAPPARETNRRYRRWAFESAALDLALLQARTDLASVLQRPRRDLEFVVSLGLSSPPSTAPLERWLERDSSLRFKVDFGDDWTADTVDALAALGEGVVAVVDLKAHYHGSFQGPAPDAALYGRIAERMPWAWLEDPADHGPASAALDGVRGRQTWDAILHSLDDVLALPWPPRCINIKPSRFGSLEELMGVYRHCEADGIGMYGGGQFELGRGRLQIQELASLFHAATPNDVAPGVYNLSVDAAGELPSSPLSPPPLGFGR